VWGRIVSLPKKIHIEDVYKIYDGHPVLDNVDLCVSTGEFCALVGPSGCGKSTLLRLILGQEQPTRGSVLIEGARAGFPDPRRGIVFQRYSLYPHLTVLDNVLLGRRLQQAWSWLPWSKPRTEDEADALELLERVRLSDAARKYPQELSGGMQQRVAIAQALIMKPPVLLMDEPFGALDPDTREELQVFLLELWEREKLTLFFVTHDLEEACFLGTRLLVLSQYYTDDRGADAPRGGKIVADYRLTQTSNATGVKRRHEFKTFIQHLREIGFDPDIRRHVKNFDLRHPDSFQTLTPEEYRGAVQNHSGDERGGSG
ncbi:MAG: ATP-binding cassette domain-containing protein, partial [Methylococcaceae bacterium]|nr:ATP-binding cassette domain-containing protein [Methylococcaceae bacterium]